MKSLDEILFNSFLFLIISFKENKKHLPYYDTPDFTPNWEMKNEKTLHKIRPFKLINQENQSFTEKDIEGKICVADYFFTTCPGICPKLATSLSSLQTEFLNDDEILLPSHIVTP
jgi:protein SCO1/2